MCKKTLKALEADFGLRSPHQKTAYIRSYTAHWQTPAEGCYFLEYSYNGRDWYVLNGGNPLSLEKCGLKATPSLTAQDVQGIEIPIDELDRLTSLYGAPEPVYLCKREDLSDCGEHPDTILVEYTNGMQEQRPLTWEGDTGRIQYNSYPAPLIMHRADPYVYKHTDGFYYFMGSHTDATHNLDGRYQYLHLILRRSRSIAGLADGSDAYTEKIIWHRDPIDGGTKSPHLWAPEIHYIHGKWYVYYTTTISDESSWRIRPHCLECSGDDPMTDAWADRGPVVTTVSGDIAFTDFSLDHTYFNHRGRDYFVWAQKTDNISDIFIAELSNPWTICTPAVCISHPTCNWESHGFAVNEGPAVLKHGDKIFIAFSASGTDATYCMGLLTADSDADLLDNASWKKCPHPVFQSSRRWGCYGPGHNSFTRSEDDRDDLFIYHGRDDARYLGDDDYQPLYDAGRNAYVGKVFWNPDGTPDFSVPGAPVTPDEKDLVIQL